MRLIDKDALKKDILDLRDCCNGFSDTYDKACIIGVIDEQPTIEERKAGEWIDEENSPFYCSECGRYQYNNTLEILQGDYKFCPYCGADMRGDNHETT